LLAGYISYNIEIEGVNMNWNKLKQQLESFLSPALVSRVEYRATGYRYSPDKSVQCYIVVDKKEVFNMKDDTTSIRWYQTEQEIKNDESLNLIVTSDDIVRVKKDSGDKIPEDRLLTIAKKRKIAQYSKDLIKAQNQLCKTDFRKAASTFLTEPIEKSLESDDILLNVLALVDRRVGKKRLTAMEEDMQMKHPIVRYFYDLRRKG